jgi:hypothetical protein
LRDWRGRAHWFDHHLGRCGWEVRWQGRLRTHVIQPVQLGEIAIGLLQLGGILLACRRITPDLAQQAHQDALASGEQHRRQLRPDQAGVEEAQCLQRAAEITFVLLDIRSGERGLAGDHLLGAPSDLGTE